MSLEIESYQNGFQYIVKTKKEDRICFGTIVPRSTSPIGKGLTTYQKIQMPEIFPKTGPGCYNTEKNTSLNLKLNKVRTKKGMTPLCNTASRFKDSLSYQIPSPGRYSTCQFLTKFKQNAAPFSSSSKIKGKQFNSIPGPGTYNINKKIKCRRSKFMDNFGFPRAVNSVEMICVKKAVDSCQKCNKICDGDYWHKDYNLFLCQLCRNEELTMHEIYGEKSLKEFKKIRNCFFMHEHQNTNAAIKILPLRKVRKKIELENYLTYYNELIEC
ncbi:unnamed protein product [Psylliodes chrysocephalus]|uniref:Uncharacterized protein n=1 Tax=Psylliodes chrysocephalus TaxID=3402493 RepID=A0A9P0DBY5_9CUCU|nr:unnamed protein product [Psylliodes chrysocephala]